MIYEKSVKHSPVSGNLNVGIEVEWIFTHPERFMIHDRKESLAPLREPQA
jgi:hypothetical protein